MIGEPRWTEYSHTVVKIILGVVFFAYLAYNINQVINSPISTLRIPERTSSVITPDIRLCFHGASVSNLLCKVHHMDGIYINKTDTVMPFDTSKLYPYSTYKNPHTSTDCWYIPRGAANLSEGDAMELSYRYVPSEDAITHSLQIDVYPETKEANPNEIIYFFDNKSTSFSPLDGPRRLDDPEITSFAREDFEAMPSSNRYTMELDSAGIITYELRNHQYLANNGWNRIGFAQIYNDTPEVTITPQIDVRDSRTTHPTPGTFSSMVTFTPTEIAKITLQDQPVRSLVNVLGSVGGLLTILVALNSFFFGSRPRSPLGLIHRFSFDQKFSMQKALNKKFGFLERPIPFVHPVDSQLLVKYNDLLRSDYGLSHLPVKANLPPQRGEVLEQQSYIDGSKKQNKDDDYDNNDYYTLFATSPISPSETSPNNPPLEQRLQVLETERQNVHRYICDLQRRFQLMELMLKGYYIDPEVFTELNNGFNRDVRGLSSTTNKNDGRNDTPEENMDSTSSSVFDTTLRSRITSAWRRRFRDSDGSTSQQGLRVPSSNNNYDQLSMEEMMMTDHDTPEPCFRK
ncbi:hypothetical protein BDA99DRAFT_275199 [Phascolomyces articulosus]|uniref:Uncharacterized protein n=1 Tax=Phascolomyces articulosus TaxID=60185 RepID=A0AAD5K780_9FUNG|nr:hypothetical protein BDA99DRAFT_275199 [Phascolomyces articulosus]